MPRPGTTNQRGYDYQHKKLRAKIKPHVDAGHATCWRCGKRIEPGTPWDLGHTEDRSRWAGPEHAACNRATTGRERPTKSAPPQSRRW